MGRKMVIFDLDGTLYNTELVSLEAIEKALEDLNLPIPPENEILSLIGDRMEDVCNALLPADSSFNARDVSERIRYYEWKFIPEKAELFDGMEDVLEILHNNGVTLSICSNGDIEYINLVLRTLEIREIFDFIKGKHPVRTKSQQLEEILLDYLPEKAILIGDRSHDIIAAKENGITSIGVTYGYGKEEVKDADFVADNPDELLKILELEIF